MADYVGLALDPDTGDLFLDDTGALALATRSNAVGQHAIQRLKTYRGEWFLDTHAGLPWFERIFVRPWNPVVAEALIKKCVKDTPGVKAITAIDTRTDFAGRAYEVRSLAVILEDGTTTTLSATI
jgi:hypothetical protein